VRAPGFTLIEMIIAIVLVGIILAATMYFAYPLRQAVDTTTRAELTDTADNALQRMARDVRLALPNSVRVTSPGSSFVEFIPLRTAGRYRAEASSPAVPCDTGTDELAFDASDTCFKTLGAMLDPGTITNNDFLVLNNYGDGFDGQNAYATTGTLNRRQIASITDEGVRQVVSFVNPGTSLSRTLHDSPGKRFFVVPGNGVTPLPVTYECTPPTLRRWSGYAMTATQPTSFPGATAALLANNVASCTFEYQANGVGPRIGLLTLQIRLTKPLSSGSLESVSLYQAVHVNNVP
jgi:MSHA biogenesis protein MshO